MLKRLSKTAILSMLAGGYGLRKTILFFLLLAFSRVYPVETRTTGMGISIGIGRFGSILGSIVFGIRSDSGMKLPT